MQVNNCRQNLLETSRNFFLFQTTSLGCLGLLQGFRLHTQLSTGSKGIRHNLQEGLCEGLSLELLALLFQQGQLCLSKSCGVGHSLKLFEDGFFNDLENGICVRRIPHYFEQVSPLLHFVRVFLLCEAQHGHTETGRLTIKRSRSSASCFSKAMIG